MNIEKILEDLKISSLKCGTAIGSNWLDGGGDEIASYSPVDGKKIGGLESTSKKQYEEVLKSSLSAFQSWRIIP